MIYFLSDAHLGSKALDKGFGRQKQLCIMLRKMGKNASAIYLLGDIFDFWFEYFIHDHSKKQYSEFMHTIRHLTHKGVRVHFFTGNHDLWTFGGLAKMTGMVVHHHPYSITVNDKSIYMAHGDEFMPDKRFQRLRRIFHNKGLQYCFRCLPPFLGNALGYGWAKRSRLKELAHPLPYQGEEKEELVQYAKQHEHKSHHDYYIFGHRHIDLDLQITANSRVVLLGDCFKLWTYAKVDDQGELTLCSYDSQL